MVLEATVLVLDNSEWMRNGDYPPDRQNAQSDCTTLLFNAKTQSNPENTVALLSSAGTPQVCVTLTTDIGKILSALHALRLKGQPSFHTSVHIAQLVLKHRQNKNQRQRIIVFVGSPLVEDQTQLVSLAKKLKKNSVAVDIISFGEIDENSQKLEAFIQAVNSNDNSHLVCVAPGPDIISDIVLNSPIISGADGPPAGLGAGFEFGVDPSLDPELALALRISMEEERARQETSNPGTATGAQPDMDQELARALQMSMGHDQVDEEMARALAMSMDQDDVEMTDADKKKLKKEDQK